MRTRKLMLRLASSALACAGLSLAGHPAFAAEYWIKADVTTLQPPGAATGIPMWGYASCTDSSFIICSAVSVPGPALTVPAGETSLTVHLKNNLTKPTSLVINGLIKPMAPVFTTDAQGRRRVQSFDAEAVPNSTADYTWPDVKPGTYLYQSGTQPQVQVQMGLYGMVSRNEREADAVAGTRARAYADDAYQYDNQAVLLYSEIDPALHAAIADGSYGTTGPTSTINYAPKYFLINGQAYGQLPTIVPTGSGGTTLLRLLNAGLQTRVPMAMGRYWDVIAEDGKPYSYLDVGTTPRIAKPMLRTQYTALLPAAKTMDVLVQHPPATGTYAIMDRRLGLSNNGASGVGGMMAFVLPGPGVGGGGTGGVPGSGTGGGTGNQPPVAANDPTAPTMWETVTGVTLNIAAPGVLANDSDPNLSQVITAV
ncbi:MAG: multicopper oxidase domain-containing protein, partial [Aquincola sp.]|nr:multicopper oxidase domain-containing protein [Aquincola sp.]